MEHARQLFSRSVCLLWVVVLAGCASSPTIRNTEITEMEPVDRSHVTTGRNLQRSPDLALFLAFSGGGTRAAAFSYGVLEKLRDTRVIIDGQERRLLDEVDGITSVSGGSFTAAYYGLFGEQIFDDYEEVFLRRNVQKTLIASLFNPINWFRGMFAGLNRTELAIDYYDRNIFLGGTYNDLDEADGPVLQINATDLTTGGRFTFNQDQFNLMCSDLGSFSIARAVAASSAVPVAFSPVTLANFDTCDLSGHPLLQASHSIDENSARNEMLIERLESFADKEARPYIHLVDGGISDNLGIRTIYNRVQASGGVKGAAKMLGGVPKNLVFIIVNAETDPDNPVDRSASPPSNREVLSAVTNAQIARYNVESRTLMEESVQDWAELFAERGREVNIFLIYLDFDSFIDVKKKQFYHSISTSFSLPNDEVDSLIDAGHTLLEGSPEFQSFVRSLNQP